MSMVEVYNPEPVTIDHAAFYPRAGPDGRTRYFIRQSGIPDMLRKHALEWWMGNQEREQIMARLRAWTHEHSAGDGVIPAGELLAELGAIEATKLYGYQRRDKKADFGTNAHDWLKWRLSGGKEPVLLPGVEIATKPATEWLETHKVEAVACECVVFDDKSGVAGRIDLAARIDGTVSIADWKTGKVADAKSGDLYLEVRLQNHLYRRGWSSMYGNGNRSKGGWILKLPSSAEEEFKAHPVPWEQHIMDLYDHLVAAWKSMRAAQGLFAGGYR